MSTSEDKHNESEIVTPTRNSSNCINAALDSEGSNPVALDLINRDSVDHPLSSFNQCSEPEPQNVGAGDISIEHDSIGEAIEQAIPLTSEENTVKEQSSSRNFIQNLCKCVRQPRESVPGVSQDQILPQSPPEPPFHFDEAIDHPIYLQKLKTDMFLLVLFGLLLSIADLGTDISTGISHFSQGNNLEGSLTIGVVLFAGIISSFCYIKEKEKRWKELASSRVMGFLMYVPCIQPIVMTIECMRFDAFLKTDILSDRHRRVAESEALQVKMCGYSDDHCDARTWFRLFNMKLAEVALFFKTTETVLEAGPQAFLQLFLFMLRVQRVTPTSWNGGLEIVTILTSLFSIALCARDNFKLKFIDILHNDYGDGDSIPPPPLVVTLLLDIISVFGFYFRIVVCVTCLVCLLQASLFICPWYLAGILTFLVIIIPRIVYIRYDIINQVTNCKNQSETDWNRSRSRDRDWPGDAFSGLSFSDFYFMSWLEKDYRRHRIENPRITFHIRQVNISAYYIITQIVVTLVCSGPKETQFITPLDSLVFKRFLILEPVLYLGFWGLTQSFFTEAPNLFFMIIFIFLLLMFYVFHFLIEKFLLNWITDTTIEFQLKCEFIIKDCEIYLQEVKNGMDFSSNSKDFRDFSYYFGRVQSYLNKVSTGKRETPQSIIEQEKASKINLLITFYKDNYFHFSEHQLQIDLLEKHKYLETLFKFTMIKLTYALLSTQWNETEVFLKAVHLVISYKTYMEDSKKYSIKKFWTYCKYFNDPKKQFRCQGLIYKFNQEKMPTLQYLDSDAHPDSVPDPDAHPDSDRVPDPDPYPVPDPYPDTVLDSNSDSDLDSYLSSDLDSYLSSDSDSN